MSDHLHARPTPLVTVADGTIKQINPFSGTEVWTVPGRGNRPLSVPAANPQPLGPDAHTATCAFCSANKLSTPPEKSRMVQDARGTWSIRRGLLPSELDNSVAEFRRVPNLFEIVSYDYWQANYGFEMHPDMAAFMQKYLSDPQGREHVLTIVRTKHDVIIGRRHYVDGAEYDNQLASSGTLTPDEHEQFIRFTLDSLEDLYAKNRYVPYVAVFQNWLKPAGASFDHLHKQLVSIDERSVQADFEIERLRANPNMFNEWAVDYAGYHNLIIAENDHAVCFAGFGHRYPTLEVYSKSAAAEPWLHTPEEVRAMSDLIHACHAAAGPDVPCNEEWHHKPIDLDIPMPWRVMIKWRVSTLAGFEGGTKIYLNTLSPFDIRDRMVSQFYALRDEGAISPNIRIATECRVDRNSLKYNPVLR